MDFYRLYELVDNSAESQAFVNEIIATLENYEHLKKTLPICTCGSVIYYEGICPKCGGKMREDVYIVFTF